MLDTRQRSLGECKHAQAKNKQYSVCNVHAITSSNICLWQTLRVVQLQESQVMSLEGTSPIAAASLCPTLQPFFYNLKILGSVQ